MTTTDDATSARHGPLPLTPPAFFKRPRQVEIEIRKLVQVYGVYAEHADAVRLYAQVLWGELDMNKMISGTEEILVKLRKLKHLARCGRAGGRACGLGWAAMLAVHPLLAPFSVGPSKP